VRAFNRERCLCDTARMLDGYFTWAAGLMYAIATTLLVSRLRGDEYAPAGRRTPLWFALVGVLLHLGHHWSVARQIGGPDLGFFAALSLVGMSMAAVCVIVACVRPIETVGAVVFPIAAIAASIDYISGVPQASTVTGPWQINLHVVVALMAYAALSIAAVVAVMLAVQETALRQRRISTTMRVFPPLTLVEGLLFQLIGAGFIGLTLTLVTGALFVEDLFAQHLAHKTVLSIAAWVVFGTLLFGRWRWGWRGRSAARLTLAGMALLILAFLGTKFVLDVMLQRGA
jgi:ABC-type uncharacterized transport system permease subunit